MSIRIMTQVWQSGPAEHYPCSVLLALADNADDAGECYPSILLLQQKARMSKSAVMRSLKWLAEDGWLEVRHRTIEAEDGRARGNLYCINLGRLGMTEPAGRRSDKREAKKHAPRSVSQTPHEAKRPVPRSVYQTPHEDTQPRSVQQTPHDQPDMPRGVPQTPHEKSVRCQEGPREVSGVKPSPAPLLVGEPSEPSQKPPYPPKTGGGASPAVVCIPPTPPPPAIAPPSERVREAFEAFVAKQRERASARASGGGGGAPAEPSAGGPVLTAPEFADVDAAVAWVMGALGFVADRRLRLVLREIMAAELAKGAGLSSTAAAMVTAWRAYEEAGPLLRFVWSPQKFFKQNHWQNRGLWPLDTERAERVHRAGRGF